MDAKQRREYNQAVIATLGTKCEQQYAALDAWMRAERLEAELGQSPRTDAAYREARALRDEALKESSE